MTTVRKGGCWGRRMMRGVVLWLFAMIGLSAVSPLNADQGVRTITLKIAADSRFRDRPGWEGEIRNSVEVVSKAWESQFGIRWIVVGFVAWEPPVDDKFLNSGKLFGHLKSTIPLAEADVVLGVFEDRCLDHLGGLGDFFGATALVMTGCLRQPESRNTIEMVISHELAHLFGAFHVRPHIRSVMSGDGPDIFDPQTSRIIRLMRERAFSKGVNSIHAMDASTQAAVSEIYLEGHVRSARNPISAAYLVSGEFLLASNKFEEAIAAFRQASLIEPEWHLPHTNMGAAYEKLGRHDLAIAAYKTAVSMNPADAQANASLGYLKAIKGDAREALENFSTAVKSDPRSASYRNNLGLAHMNLGQLSKAESEFREALRLDPTVSDIRNNLAASLGQQGKLEEAVDVLREAIRRDPADSKAQANLGYTLELMGDTNGALNAYRKAQAMDPANSRNQANLDRLLSRTGKNKADNTRRK